MIRFATNDEGLVIRNLTIQNGANANFAMVLDWSRVGENWLVDARGGKIVGALQVCFGLPTTRLENLCVDQALDGRTRAKIMMGLRDAALALCKQLGASAVNCFVPFTSKAIKRHYKKWGFAVGLQGNTMFKVL